MPRAPEPGDECRPGGSYPECNPAPLLCAWCGDHEVEDREQPCEWCAYRLADGFRDDSDPIPEGSLDQEDA